MDHQMKGKHTFTSVASATATFAVIAHSHIYVAVSSCAPIDLLLTYPRLHFCYSSFHVYFLQIYAGITIPSSYRGVRILYTPAVSFFIVGANVIHRDREIFTIHVIRFSMLLLRTTPHSETCTSTYTHTTVGTAILIYMHLHVYASYQIMKSERTTTEVRILQL